MKAIICYLLLFGSVLFCVSCDKATEPDIPLVLSVTPDSGSYPASKQIAVSCNASGADIRYTTNGMEPDQTSQLYTSTILAGDIVVTQFNFVTFKAKAFKAGYSPSLTVTREYSIDYENIVAAPVISPGNGNYEQGTSITLSCATAGAQIRYTINSSEPNLLSSLYQQPITINNSGLIIVQARSFKQNCIPSPTVTNFYFFAHPVQEMSYVEGGNVSTGNSEVSLSSFYMDKCEVSQTDYYDVMGSIPDVTLPCKGNYPVYYVSWFDAIAYCNKRSLLENKAAPYAYNNMGGDPEFWPTGWNLNDANHSNISCNWNADGYRLPTEMEWMFAARGGTLGHNYQYCGSDSIYAVAWYAGNSGYTVHQVATKEPNELGINDLSGNLSEWCWDIFANYPSGLQSNPHGASSGSQRVFRGGAWNSPAAMCQVDARNSALPSLNTAASIGFRCVRPAR
ncbi:MAG: SUMF1/EgtB/PvdO family nonheme iron enzyme [Candidatus Cloacimonas sp.]|nr:SUMF1/EgtB/PvdO family nonheme iron enzyme [Candidatus Cloacimonas sp.]